MQPKEPNEPKEPAQPGKKLEQASRSAAARELGPWMLRVAEFMQLRPKEQTARIVQVRCPNPNVFSFHEQGAEAVYKKIKDVSGGANGNASKRFSPQQKERQLAERIWALAVEGVVDDAALGYSVFGYTVAPTRDTITDPKYFRFMTSRNQPFFHSSTLSKRGACRAERSDQTRTRHTLTSVNLTSYDFPAFDPRFVIQRWLDDLKPDELLNGAATPDGAPPVAASAPAPTPRDAPAPAPRDAPAAPAKKPRSRPKKAPHDEVAPAPAEAEAEAEAEATPFLGETSAVPGFALSTAEVLLAKNMRVQAASMRLPELIASKAVEVLDERLFGLAETQRFGYFPTDFAVDIAGLFATPDPLPAAWQTWPYTAAIIVAANPDRFAPQGLHRFLASHSSQGVNAPALRTDTQARVIDSWSRNAVANTWDMATLATEVFSACKTIDILSDTDSVLFVKARTLFTVAECTDRVLRVLRDATVPSPGRICAFTGELLAAGTTHVTTIDLQLRAFPAVSETPKFVRVYVAPTVSTWAISDQPDRKKKKKKRARPDAEAEPALKVQADTPVEEPPKKKKKTKTQTASDPVPAAAVIARIAGWPTLAVNCSPVWAEMRRSAPPGVDAEKVAAVRRNFNVDKTTLRAWVASDDDSNYIIFDMIFCFFQTMAAPRALSLLDSSDGDNEKHEARDLWLTLPHAKELNPATLTTLLNASRKERLMTAFVRSKTAKGFFEQRVAAPDDVKALAPDAFEWVVFAALFDGAQGPA